ncbi:MAG: hypothetical protein KAR76_06570 [Methanosarcinales archaeon]|nr:hypothetical protein [Methanosarcinales archaeon]
MDNYEAIDSVESNVYPNTPIDIDNESEVGSKKQTDLDGGGEGGNGRGVVLGDAAGCTY